VTDIANMIVSDPALDRVIGKVADGERLLREDGLLLEKTRDLHTVWMLGDSRRSQMHGNRAGYIINAHIDYTNICTSGCRFCAFGRRPGAEGGFVVTPEEAVERVPDGVDEIHLVGGLNPDLSLDYFIRLLSALREAYPQATLKAFTAVELRALADREKMEVKQLLLELKEAGLGMIPGGGAEIFDEETRRSICPNKADAEEWLEIHRAAHELGIPSNSTMLYGHVEKAEHRVDHLLRLRKLQDETGGFVAHVPLPYLRGANELATVAGPPDGSLDLRQVALARLLLDNVPHVKAYWRALGVRMAQAALRAGADDLDGSIAREDVMHEAGSDAPRSLTADRLERLISGAGLEPYRRDSMHRPIKEVYR